MDFKTPIAHSREDVDTATAAVRKHADPSPRVALILGSGLGAIAEGLEGSWEMEAGDIPGYPESTVDGHGGKLVGGTRCGVEVVMQSGRLHLYEGYPASAVVFPLRVMRGLGAEILIVTNAAGGIGSAMTPGRLMLIEDHINLQFAGPLRGRGSLVDADRFVDLCEPYSKRLLDLARNAAREKAIPGVCTGIYCATPGPSYETPSEVAVLRDLGADAVGMSTVPEVIAAKHTGMEVLGVSCIANRAAGLASSPLSHAEVIAETERARDRFCGLIDAVLEKIGENA